MFFSASPSFKARIIFRAARLTFGLLLYSAWPLHAFVTLDTSTPEAKQDAKAHADTLLPSQPPENGGSGSTTVQAALSPSSFRPEKPHCSVVLFLAADDYEVYSALGLMAAMQAYGLQPDCVVGESRAAFVATAFALGYSAAELEAMILDKPEDSWILPFKRARNPQVAANFSDGEDPAFSMTLVGQSLQADKARWMKGPEPEAPEYLHIAWNITRLTYDAPQGPCDSVQDTPIPMALQVYDAEQDRLRTVERGDLSGLLKASLLPPQVARDRAALRPFTDGSPVSAHDFNIRDLPFTFDHILALRLSHHLQRRMFGGEVPTWRDSLEHGYQEGKKRNLDSLALAGKVGYIDVQADPREKKNDTPEEWRELGYQAALKHMDLLLRLLSGNSSAEKKAAARTSPAVPAITVDPLASGGRDLLLDLLRELPTDTGWKMSRKVMNTVMETGFYQQLDVDWQQEGDSGQTQWVFSANEKSKLVLWASPQMRWTPEPMSMRGPEILTGLSWSEPYFIPMKFEVMGDFGGREAGWAIQAFAQPLTPLPLRTGIRHAKWEVYHPDFGSAMPRYGVINYRLREKRTSLFLDIGPNAPHHVSGDISVRNLQFIPGLINPGYYPYFANQTDLDSLRTLVEANGEICLGCKSTGEWLQPGLRIHYRTAQNVNEGQVKPVQYQFAWQEWLSTPFAKAMIEGVWSNYPKHQVDLYDYYTGPEVTALSFSPLYFFLAGKGLRFLNLQGELTPRLGDLQGRLALGWIKHYGETIMPRQTGSGQGYWEVDVAYPTPLGPIRFGIGALDRFDPLYVLQIGVNGDLLQALEGSRL